MTNNIVEKCTHCTSRVIQKHALNMKTSLHTEQALSHSFVISVALAVNFVLPLLVRALVVQLCLLIWLGINNQSTAFRPSVFVDRCLAPGSLPQDGCPVLHCQGQG